MVAANGETCQSADGCQLESGEGVRFAVDVSGLADDNVEENGDEGQAEKEAAGGCQLQQRFHYILSI